MFVTIHNKNPTKFQTQHVTRTPVNMVGFAQKQTQDMRADAHDVAVQTTWQAPTVKLVRIIYFI